MTDELLLVYVTNGELVSHADVYINNSVHNHAQITSDPSQGYSCRPNIGGSSTQR